MSVTRKCDRCGKTIEKPTYLEVQVRVMKTDEDSDQDCAAQSYGDFCDQCVYNGLAIDTVTDEVKEVHPLTIESAARGATV